MILLSIKTFIKQIQSGELDILEHTQKLEDGEKRTIVQLFITPSTEYALERAVAKASDQRWQGK